MNTLIPTSGVCPRTRPRSRTDSSLADEFVLTLWTNDVGLASEADRVGIQRIGVDLDRLGKVERQRGLGTWISPHREEDLGPLGGALKHAMLFARVDPLSRDSRRQVESVLAHGTRVLMLPMVATPEEAAEFVELVDGRARIVLLVERREALDRLDELVTVDGVDEIHIGLNDLAISLGLPNRWVILEGDALVDAGTVTRDAGLRFGLGGLGRAGDDRLPIPSDLIYAEYARTGAMAALVSRSFHASGTVDLGADIDRATRRLAWWRQASAEDLGAAHTEFGRRARALSTW
jgi:hypothetical protein